MHDRPEGKHEPADQFYVHAARYDGQWAGLDAERAYRRSRRDLHRAPTETDLSVFRLQIGNRINGVTYLGWYVTLIGTRPDEALATRLEHNLAGGTAVELPDEVTTMLHERRERNANLALWIERRYGRVTRADIIIKPEHSDGLPKTRR